jgi:DNA polymerase-1
MRYISFVDKDTYSTALLIKDSSFSSKEIQENYLIDWQDTICFSLAYENNKAPVKLIKESLGSIIKACNHLKVTHILVCDANYFKVLTKKTKAEPYYGSVCRSFDDQFNVILAPNYQALFYNPSLQSKIDLAVSTLKSSLTGSHIELGVGIIHYEEYPDTLEDLQECLQKLHNRSVLTCDIETQGLHLSEADIVSISFAWSQHEGVAFLVLPEVKPILRDWFDSYKGRLIFHNATFDVTQLIYRLFMKDYLDYEGLLHGLDVFSNIDDTKIIAYLATNSCAGNELSLKKLALPFAGNYALLDDETDVTKIPTPELLRYNLTDTLATWYVYNQYYPKMVEDDQLKIYQEIMLPSIRSIIHMQLIGFPMDKDQIYKTDIELSNISKHWKKVLSSSPIVKKYEWELQVKAYKKKNSELKTKVIPISEFKTQFNPNSGNQVSGLLYEYMGLPVIETTDTGLPSTDGDTLNTLFNRLINEYQLTEDDLK